MKVYYNEIDDFCCAWLSNLMDDGLISPGKIDNRSIWDVLPDEVSEYDRAHFFAGIGVWELALNLTGWHRPVWTGSAPCQPFSAAGKGEGFADERHLWPAWFHLITHGKRHDIPVLGEQVAAKAGRAWFDLVSGDMEALGHACGALDTSAAGCGAPFIGQRLYWLASAHHQGSQGYGRPGQLDAAAGRQMAIGHSAATGAPVGLAASETPERQCQWTESPVFAVDARLTNGGDDNRSPDRRYERGDGIPLHPVDYWRDADWLLCRDPNGARFRPVEPPTQRMAHVGAVGRSVVDRSGEGQTHFPLAEKGEYLNRLNEVRGFGNALNVAQAATFCEIARDYLDGVPVA